METVIIGLCALIAGVFAGYFVLKKTGAADGSVSANEYRRLSEDLVFHRTKKEVFEKLASELKETNERLNGEKEELRSQLGSYKTHIADMQNRFAEKKAELEALERKMNENFTNIASRVLAANTDSFKKHIMGDLTLVLDPVRENLRSFESKLSETQNQQTGTIGELKAQITHLTGMNQLMAQETKNLTTALKGESKTRGSWGEVILETILERSGLIRDEHYTRESVLKNDEGKLRPDVIVNLPDSRHIIIDSKLSLVDYERFVNAEDETQRAIHLKKHVDAVKLHISQLAAKNYQNLYGINSPDFVLMFIPLEPAFHTAIENDRDLFANAYEKNIVLTAPTTLIPTLKIINTIWRQENQNRNAMAIAEAGGKLYDKFAGFVKDMQDVGTAIDSSRKAYDGALNKLSTGKGNLIGQAEKMRVLGAKNSKLLPAELLDE